MKQRRIGCIFTLFHLREFSNVFSNRLPEQMESRNDCIWTTFHLREFSDVLSNRLPEKMESCKWLHLYAFFNSLLKFCAWTDAKSHFFAFLCFSPEWVWVSSICLPVQMQSRIDGICTLFLQSEFECPRIACLYRFKVTLIAFERFFAQVSFQM